MRQKRAKQYKKLMSLYSLSFGFRQPYQVLIDATFCTQGVQMKIELEKQLGVVVQGSCKPMITQCCMVELYKLGKSDQETIDIAKAWERRKCNHREAIPGDECVASVVGLTNKHRYVIATQSQDLQSKLREIPAVPVIHINRTVMILAPPSQATLDAKAQTEDAALHPTKPELAQTASRAPEQPVKKKKRKGPKEPNPLSVRKKQSKLPQNQSPSKTTKNESSSQAADRMGDAGEVGKKRKRAEDGGVRMEGNVIGGGEGDAERGTKKRKRRRKAKASGDGEVAAEE